MHLHNGLHHATALQAAYLAALGADDPEFSGIERAGESLTPVIDLWSRPEWYILRSSTLATGGIALAAPGAGLISEIMLWNARDDQLLVARFEAGSSAVAAFEIRRHAAKFALDAAIWKGSRDFRALSPVRGEIWYINTAAAATGTRLFQSPVVALNTPYREHRWWILPPNTGLSVNTQAQNQALAVNFEWYERRALPGEL